MHYRVSNVCPHQAADRTRDKSLALPPANVYKLLIISLLSYSK